jgi:hypothetical protein
VVQAIMVVTGMGVLMNADLVVMVDTAEEGKME